MCIRDSVIRWLLSHQLSRPPRAGARCRSCSAGRAKSLTAAPASTRRQQASALRLGAAGRVLEPPELAAEVRAEARRALAAYDAVESPQRQSADPADLRGTQPHPQPAVR